MKWGVGARAREKKKEKKTASTKKNIYLEKQKRQDANKRARAKKC